MLRRLLLCLLIATATIPLAGCITLFGTGPAVNVGTGETPVSTEKKAAEAPVLWKLLKAQLTVLEKEGAEQFTALEAEYRSKRLPADRFLLLEPLVDRVNGGLNETKPLLDDAEFYRKIAENSLQPEKHKNRAAEFELKAREIVKKIEDDLLVIRDTVVASQRYKLAPAAE